VDELKTATDDGKDSQIDAWCGADISIDAGHLHPSFDTALVSRLAHPIDSRQRVATVQRRNRDSSVTVRTPRS